MSVNVAKSYLDMARSVIDTDIGAKANASPDDIIFSILSCTYIYSYHSLISFYSAQLYLLWSQENSPLKEKHSQVTSFEELMVGPLRDIKSALKELTTQNDITPLHLAKPKLWQMLNEFVKNHRDFFIHPNPEKFDSFVGKNGNAQWKLPSETASGILEYMYQELYGHIPKWVNKSSIKIHGIEVVDI